MPLTHGTELLRRTAHRSFWQSFETTPDQTTSITFRASSDSDQETYPFLSAAPSPIEMAGERTHKAVPQISYAIKNKKWESTVNISYEMLRFNKIEQVAALSAELGQKARIYPANIISGTLMNSGSSTAGPDTQNFYDTDHTDPGADFQTSGDNDRTTAIVAATAPTDIEFAAAVRDGIDQLIGFKDGQGDPVWVGPNTIWEVHVPAAYYSVARRVETADSLTGPVGNDLQGRFTTIFNPYIDAAGTTAAFYMHNPSGVRKPFVFQTATPTEFDNGIGTDFNKETKDSWIGTFMFGNGGYGDWRYSLLHTFTTI